MLYLLLQMCLVLKLWFTVFWGEYIYILQETFTLNSDISQSTFLHDPSIHIAYCFH